MQRYSRQTGVAAVEMAFLLMPLIFIVFGITEFGRAFYQYNTVVKATRDAARYLSGQQPGTKDAEATCLVKYGNYSACLADPSYTGPLLAPGLATATISICDWPRCANHNAQGSDPVVNLVSVTVSNYQFTSLVPFVTSGLSTITFSDIHTTMKANL
ncbi:TadE/TadG family type IV pilus assembly protein [Pseudogulbenkiania subflava]|uniref:Flp pilus assembly protein TadG n=1 Tax=Pseudogulbenkiania subflava DSM 22618 TaxID=1123014 RepID=A0A1Y6BGT2_9NEIS|nr:TadE/TadG family type IV pilus assembly protein [Pseudogulbenkiania subflava]SMF10843.1 Flp pilus assembly protein TadG [Pseudogulbenkiania subflava DSM 22618]